MTDKLYAITKFHRPDGSIGEMYYTQADAVTCEIDIKLMKALSEQLPGTRFEVEYNDA